MKKSHCKNGHDLSITRRPKNSPSGKRTHCSECRRIKDRKFGRLRNIKRRYGSTTYLDEMFNQQHGLCSICQKPLWAPKGPYHVDHDHQTGQIRALLCFSCNVGLGHFNDDPELLEAAAHYLHNH